MIFLYQILYQVRIEQPSSSDVDLGVRVAQRGAVFLARHVIMRFWPSYCLVRDSCLWSLPATVEVLLSILKNLSVIEVLVLFRIKPLLSFCDADVV